MIHVLWPTCRPAAMLAARQHWHEMADDVSAIHDLVAVDTAAEAALLDGHEVHVVGREGCGVVQAVNLLTRIVVAQPGDVLILSQDDVFPQCHWDSWVREQLADWGGCLLVNDGYQYGGCVTVPVMGFECFVALNRIINHPAYFHQYADAELFQNVTELGLIRNVRDCPMMFEHRHWANGKRAFDLGDCNGSKHGPADAVVYEARMRLPLADRLVS